MHRSKRPSASESPNLSPVIFLLCLAVAFGLLTFYTELFDPTNYFNWTIQFLLLAYPIIKGITELITFIKTRKYEQLRSFDRKKNQHLNSQVSLKADRSQGEVRKLKAFQKCVMEIQTSKSKIIKKVDNIRLNREMADPQILNRINKMLDKNSDYLEENGYDQEVSDFTFVGKSKGEFIMHKVKELMLDKYTSSANVNTVLGTERNYYNPIYEVGSMNPLSYSSRIKNFTYADQIPQLPANLAYKVKPNKIVEAMNCLREYLLTVLQTSIYISLSQQISQLNRLVKTAFMMELKINVTVYNETSIEQLREVVKIFRVQKVLPEKFRKRSQSYNWAQITLTIQQIQIILDKIPDFSQCPNEVKLTLYCLALSYQFPKFKVEIENPYNHIAQISAGGYLYSFKRQNQRNSHSHNNSWRRFYIFSDQKVSMQKYKNSLRTKNVEFAMVVLFLDGIKEYFGSGNSLIRSMRQLLV